MQYLAYRRQRNREDGPVQALRQGGVAKNVATTLARCGPLRTWYAGRRSDRTGIGFPYYSRGLGDSVSNGMRPARASLKINALIWDVTRVLWNRDCTTYEQVVMRLPERPGGNMTERRTARRYDLTLPVMIRVPIERESLPRVARRVTFPPDGVYLLIDNELSAGAELDLT